MEDVEPVARGVEGEAEEAALPAVVGQRRKVDEWDRIGGDPRSVDDEVAHSTAALGHEEIVVAGDGGECDRAVECGHLVEGQLERRHALGLAGRRTAGGAVVEDERSGEGE